MSRVPSMVVTAFLKEVRIIFMFIENDIWDTIIPCLLTFIAAFVYNHKPLAEFPLALLSSIIYAILYILTFCVCNQLEGVEEDRVNKPYRPLVTGLLTVTAARKRNIIYNILFLLAALWLKVFWFAVGWQVITLMLCRWGFSNHWYLKNVFCITLGTIMLLGAMWSIISPINREVWNFIGLLSLWAGLGLPLQDLRDVEGDRLMNRKTLPLAIGDTNSRMLLSAHLSALSPIIYTCVLVTQSAGLADVMRNKLLVTMALLQVLWHWSIALRLWLYRTPREDDTTYHWFVYLFCVTIPLVCFL
ncbi:MAG TPA: UbiA family prenyltransferase [Chitinophaga sp.]|uniref:UbiA family prenyltransferase n=1 Tax=Chitinophaga sp. TaxID=1869181 RepID=UPI002BB9B4E4|nr:UbiA family prenyltransferase [Chitinophaga sp.]HVI47204.1 UbiA family prenyltransferase [Chitinophaga sp.]